MKKSIFCLLAAVFFGISGLQGMEGSGQGQMQESNSQGWSLFSQLPREIQKYILSFLPGYFVFLRCNHIDNESKLTLEKLGFTCKKEGNVYSLQSPEKNWPTLEYFQTETDKNKKKELLSHLLKHSEHYLKFWNDFKSNFDKERFSRDFCSLLAEEGHDALFLEQIFVELPINPIPIDQINAGFNVNIIKSLVHSKYFLARYAKKFAFDHSNRRLAIIAGNVVLGAQKIGEKWKKLFMLYARPTIDGNDKTFTQNKMSEYVSIVWDEGPFVEISFSNDGHYFAVQKNDGSLRVYNLGSIKDGDCASDLINILTY